jgi:hypothetical protein
MNAAAAIQRETCIIPGTHRRKGRTQWLAPGTSAVRHLHYGRIVLDSAGVPLSFSSGTRKRV